MALKVLETFMKINTKTGEYQVFRYSIHNGLYQIDIAEIKDDIFDDESRETNWDWISENANYRGGDEQTYWSTSILSEGEFEDNFKPDQIKADGDIFATFKDFQDTLEEMRNKSPFLKKLFED